MRVLFISSQTSNGLPSSLVLSQGNDLKEEGVLLEYFVIKHKGLKGYLKSIFELRAYVKKNQFDIYHAHYGLTALVATFAFVRPLIVSLMGSDVKEGGWQLFLIRLFGKTIWKRTITKSSELSDIIKNKQALVIPNGVNLDKFCPMEQGACRKKIGWAENETYVLFPANKARYEKNYQLAKKACEGMEGVELKWLNNVSNQDMPFYYNAADVILMTSLWEGSPNAIKEAMACNRPIVCTNVGDVSWLSNGVHGNYISSFEPSDVKEKVMNALDFSRSKKSTKGRETLLDLELDSKSVAGKILNTYKEILDGNSFQ